MTPTTKLATTPTTSVGIRLGDIEAVESFGDSFTTTLANLSTSLSTSEAKLKSLGDVGSSITELLSTTKSLDANTLLDKPGFLDRILSRTTANVEKFIDKQKTVSEAVKATSLKLLNDRNFLVTENQTLQHVYEDYIIIVDKMSQLINDGFIRLQDLKTEFAAVKTQTEQSDSSFLQIQNYQQCIDRFDQKLERLSTAKSLISRQLVQVKIMQNINTAEADTIKDTVDVAIPLWESQIGLVISQLKTKTSIDNRKNVQLVINETIQKNAQLMSQNTADVIEGSTSSIISIESVQAVQTSLISSITALQEAANIGRQKRADTFLQLTAMDDELKQTLIK